MQDIYHLDIFHLSIYQWLGLVYFSVMGSELLSFLLIVNKPLEKDE